MKLHELLEAKGEYNSFKSWKAAIKKKHADAWIEGDEDIAQAMVGPKPYKQGETKSVGEWDGAKGELYEAIALVKHITKAASYRESAVTEKFKSKLGKAGEENDVSITYSKPRYDRNEGENFITMKLTGTREDIKKVAKAAGLHMSDDSLNEEYMSQKKVKAHADKIKRQRELEKEWDEMKAAGKDMTKYYVDGKAGKIMLKSTVKEDTSGDYGIYRKQTYIAKKNGGGFKKGDEIYVTSAMYAPDYRVIVNNPDGRADVDDEPCTYDDLKAAGIVGEPAAERNPGRSGRSKFREGKEDEQRGRNAAEAGRGQSMRDVNDQPGFFKKYKAIAVKHGWKQRADHLHHPQHGTIEVNRHGEWEHLPHGSLRDNDDGFGGSNELNFEKHLKKLNEGMDAGENALSNRKPKAKPTEPRFRVSWKGYGKTAPKTVGLDFFADGNGFDEDDIKTIKGLRVYGDHVMGGPMDSVTVYRVK